MIRHIAVLLALVATAVSATAQAVKQGTQYAFLVACSGYDKNELKSLPYSLTEMDDFQKALVGTGFDTANIKYLHDKAERRYQPEKDKIVKEFKLLMERAGPNDTVVVVLNGHGVHFTGDKTGYFCPLNADLGDKKTLWAMDGDDGVYPLLKACKAGRKLLLVNACRNDPAADRALAARKVNIDDEDKDEVPEGIAALYSCKAGQRSYYYDPKDAKSKDRERSIFFHHLIEAWQGKYAGEGKVTLEHLFEQVKKRTAADADDIFARNQTPEIRRDYSGDWAIGRPSVPVTPIIPPKGNESFGPKPAWLYAHDLKVRKGGDTDFENAPKIGVEFFKEPLSGATLAISQAGTLSVINAGQPGANTKAEWLFAHDIRARKADEDKFTKDTTKYGVEVFVDTASGKLIYISQTGGLALGGIAATAKDKGPVWHYALLLKVRGPNEDGFTKDTKKFGVEVYKDENTGGLVYITEAGMLAAGPAPATAPEADKVKAPKPLYGLTCRVRKADELNLDDPKTAKYGVEVFKDDNTGGLIYISETGSIAVVAAGDIKEKQGLEWKKAMSLKARPGGVPEFAKANKFGIEVFVDKNTGNYLFISDTGSIAVFAK